MRRIVTGATGLIGKRLVTDWLAQNHEIIVIGRSAAHIKEVFGSQVQAVVWSDLTEDLFAPAEVVVNLAGANIGSARWTVARKQEVINSRVEATKTIAELLAKLGKEAPLLLNASAIGVYGLQASVADELPHHLDEGSEIPWDAPPDFLSTVATQWEKAAAPAIEKGVRVIFLRFGVVLAKEGGALPAIVRPFQFFVGGPIGTGQQPFCWIAIDDLIRAIDFLIATPNISGAVNIVAPECVSQKRLADTIGSVMHRPAMVPMPAIAMKLLLGEEMARELLLEGQNVYPKRLLDLNFRFSYPTIESALEHLLTT